MAVVGYLRHDIQGLVPKKDRLTEALNTMPPGATGALILILITVCYS